MKALKLLVLALCLILIQLSCSSDSSDVNIIITDDDLVGDVSIGDGLVDADINRFGQWVASGNLGVGIGSGNRTDFSLLSAPMGSDMADKAIALNDNGNFVLAVESGIFFGDLNGQLVQVYAGNNGQFIQADINDNDIWLVASEDGLFIGSGTQEAIFLDYVNNLGEFSHCAINSYDEFVAAGSLQTLFGYVDTEGVVELFSYDSVSVFNDSVWTDINEFGEFIVTGSLDTLLGVADEKGSKVNRVVRSGEKKGVKASGTTVDIELPKVDSGGTWTVNHHYEPYYKRSSTRLKVNKALPIYHCCAINGYTEYVAAGDDYLLVNDVNYSPVTGYNEMVRVDLNDAGYWVAAGTYGLYADGDWLLDAMADGDWLALKQDDSGDYVYGTSVAIYDFSMITENLVNNGPVADFGYPVAADMENGRWVAVGNYGVLLWNY